MMPRKTLYLNTMGSDNITFHGLRNTVLIVERDGDGNLSFFLRLLEFEEVCYGSVYVHVCLMVGVW